MAVYTEVDADSAAALLRTVGAGALRTLAGAAGGIENTNYFVESDAGDWVLTLFERLGFEQLPFYLGLMQHLARRGLPVPEPRTDAGGALVHRLAGKPAALVNRLPGAPVDAPDARHCGLIGQFLARMHLQALDFPGRQDNLRGLAWWERTVPIVRPHVAPDQAARLDGELAWQHRLHDAPATKALPRGPVHADLFRDNALFDGPQQAPRLSGVFDFYFAGIDALAYDLAVCLNDWAIDVDSGRLQEERAQALVAAYHAERPLGAGEQRALPGLRRAAALRFWLSRLADWYLPRPAALLSPKDPAHFERVLQDCIARPWHPGLA